MHCINNMNRIASGLIIASCVFYSCTSRSGEIPPVHGQQTDSLLQDTIVQPEVKPVDKNSQQSRYKSLKICCTTNIHWMISILIKTLPGSFNGIKSKNSWPYSKYTVAAFHVGNSPELQNRNGEAPLVRSFKRNAYGRVADTLGIERYQSVPLYLLTDTLVPERYGQDGELTRFIENGEKFIKAEPVFTGDEWMIPKSMSK